MQGAGAKPPGAIAHARSVGRCWAEPVARSYRRVASWLLASNPASPDRTPRPHAPDCTSARSTMGHYRSNVRDLEFNLFEVFGRQQVLGTG
ncbi:MAG: acyl-CoA dehydrogenase N-terminal domain-containing protein, partial [Rhodoferax sp.]|nr:acyl-CoA dehydrogenase N-terminal domain-containing protein [Actinomycetota bacterium]